MPTPCHKEIVKTFSSLWIYRTAELYSGTPDAPNQLLELVCSCMQSLLVYEFLLENINDFMPDFTTSNFKSSGLTIWAEKPIKTQYYRRSTISF